MSIPVWSWLLALAIAVAVAPSLCHAQATDRPLGLANASPVSPTVAAELLLAEQATLQGPAGSLSPRSDAQGPIRDAWLKARRSHWLLGTGIGIMAGSALGGLLAGRSRYCSYHEYDVNKRPPRVAAAVLGTVGLTLTVVGALRFQHWPSGDLMLTRRRHRQRVAIGFASLGLALASMGIVGVAAVPGIVSCGTT